MTGIHDNHNHLVANGDPVAMLRAAEAKGLAGFSFTEHVFHLDEPRVASRYLGTRWDGELEGPPIGVGQYLGEIAEAAQAVPAVVVGAGLELEHWPDDPRVREVQDAFVAAHADDWDLILGSVHCLTGDHSIFDPSTPLSSGTAWDDYFERLGDAVEHGGFDVVTHPVRLAVSRPDVPGDLARQLDRLAELAAGADVALEVNGSDVRVYPELVQLLCESIARAGAPVSLGSDAHRPHGVGAVLKGVDLLRAAGVRHAVAFERRRRRDVAL
ncbi:MAG: PHP domain-containing protein [Actinomycetota bacterium]|nr:PHP domain-containing protein [Actinomycetota bacterium]